MYTDHIITIPHFKKKNTFHLNLISGFIIKRFFEDMIIIFKSRTVVAGGINIFLSSLKYRIPFDLST